MDNVQTSDSSSPKTCSKGQQEHTTNDKIGWQWCPEDILWLIYEKLDSEMTDVEKRQYRYKSNEDEPVVRRKAGLAAHSTVCKKWQEFFEPLLYRRLDFNQYDLYKFSNITRVKDLVQYIHFRIQHQSEDCSECYGHSNDSLEVAIYDEKATWIHIERFFTVLNKWQRSPYVRTQRLTLRMNIHFVDSLRMHTGQSQLVIDPETLEMRKRTRYESLCATYRSLVEQQHDFWMKSRDAQFGSALPPVGLVTGFMIGNYTSSRISSGRILQALPNLEFIHHESWSQPWESPWFPHATEEDCLDIFSQSLLQKVNRIVTRKGHYHADSIARCLHHPLKLKSATAAMARRSRSLEYFSAAGCLVEADYFFRACEPDWRWVNLKSLFLTSRLFADRDSSAKISKMLVQAGNVALRMPCLETMEIRKGSNPKSAFFKYEVETLNATLTWGGGPDRELEPTVQDVWRNVARLNANCNLYVSMKVIDPGEPDELEY